MAGLAVALLVLSASSSPAQERNLRKAKVGVPSISTSNVIPWVAKEAGIFAKYGLDVEFVVTKGPGEASQALIGGSLYTSPVATPTVINSDLAGADLAILAHTLPGVVNKLMVKPGLKTVADLKGKKIGVTRFGSLTDFLTRYILQKHGLRPDKDVALIQLGGEPQSLRTLLAGQVDGGALSHPGFSQAEERGYRPLWDASKEVSYPFMEIVFRRKTIRGDRGGVLRYVNAHLEGIHAFKTDKGLSLRVMAKYLKISDRKLLEESYELYAPQFLPAPYPNVEGMKTSFDYVAQKKPQVWKHKAEEFVDPSFIAELDRSGFIRKLYGL